uniref:Uncharacterized protein n=1 Tax=Anguilla anguilla TaxID=7936 RepID=A0A0E9XFG1_ANGAN
MLYISPQMLQSVWCTAMCVVKV